MNIEYMLSDWRTLTKELSSNEFTLEELATLLKVEMEGKRRKSFVVRIHGKYSRQKSLEKRKELIDQLDKEEKNDDKD